MCIKRTLGLSTIHSPPRVTDFDAPPLDSCLSAYSGIPTPSPVAPQVKLNNLFKKIAEFLVSIKDFDSFVRRSVGPAGAKRFGMSPV